MAQLGEVSVSRETIDDLHTYADMLSKWTKGINLISPGTVDHIWHRHIVDSAQIYNMRPETATHWLDLGSGGGLPGLVIAIIAKHHAPNLRVTLIESDQRKAVFLRSVLRDIRVDGKVIAKRIADVDPQDADVVSARALASTSDLLPFLQRHLSRDGVALFHKGKNYQKELAVAAENWAFDLEEQVSLTDPDARILCVRNISSLGQSRE